MDAKEFESALSRLLGLRFANPDDPGLADRRRQLIALFKTFNNPALATIYYARLGEKNERDALAREFQHRLATPTRAELLQILLRNSGQGAAAPAADTPAGPRYRLIDQDEGGERWITRDDREFRERYIDSNIVNVTSDPDPRTADHYTMVVEYANGRTLELSLASVPVRQRYYDPDNPRARFARLRFQISPDAYLLRNGLIFPVDHHRDVMFNDTLTPTLIDIRTTLEFNIRQRRTLLQIAELVNAFAGSISLLGGFYASYSHGLGWTFVPKRGRKSPSVSLNRAGPPDGSYRAQKQYKIVKLNDMLMWEREGGHTLAKHNSLLTRENLKERVLGVSRLVPAPQTKKGGVKPPDLRVWRGEKTVAASKWTSDATMQKAIGDLIHKNLDTIRRTTAGGGEVLLSNQPVGYKTGEGWVTTAGPKPSERAAFYDESLTGATILIRPRRNHVPTANDPESWYVHTAYPDTAK